jgi:hypothetical protein
MICNALYYCQFHCALKTVGLVVPFHTQMCA